MWLEKTLLKRRAGHRDAAVRREAVDAMDAAGFHDLLLELALNDPDAAVRRAVLEKIDDPAELELWRSRESDPELSRKLARRLDLIYSEEALAAEMTEGDPGDALERIAAPEVLLETALRATSANLILAIGAKLSLHEDQLLRLLCNLTQDDIALELYRKFGEKEAWEDEILCSARSAALREAVAAVRARRRQDAERIARETALVERAEQLADAPDAEAFEEISRQWREEASADEALKTRFLAAKYRHCQALESKLAAQQAWERDHEAARNIVMELAALEGACTFEGCGTLVAAWREGHLDDAPGAAEFKERFAALAGQYEAELRERAAAEDAALAAARAVLAGFSGAAERGELPELAVRQKALADLAEAEKTLKKIPAAWVDLKEKILELDRAFRRRAREENQVRDLARWEHYTVKMDICLELEKLAEAADADLVKAARQFRILRGRWQEIGSVPQEKYPELRDRYHAVCSALHKRLEAFFTARDEAFKAAEAGKKAICEEAEALSGSEDWEPTSSRLKELQAQWKTLPAAPHGVEHALFSRFHTACDAFFVRRNAAWEKRKRAFQEASAAKKSLCERAEALKQQPFATARRAVAALREEWKSLPSAGRDDHALFGEFNRAIDAIFAAHREAEDENRRRSEILCMALVELAENASARQLAIPEIERKLAENQRDWDQLGDTFAPGAEQRRAEALRQLRFLLARFRHEAARSQLEESLHLEEFAELPADESKLRDHLERRQAVTSELERRLRECRILSGGGDLAGELALAIAGNFGGGAHEFTLTELDDFLRRFLAVGPVPATEREAVFGRFSGLYQRALEYFANQPGEGAEAQSSGQ